MKNTILAILNYSSFYNFFGAENKLGPWKFR